MKLAPAWLRRIVSEHRLRGRFPDSVIHRGAMADSGSVLGKHTVLFNNVFLSGSNLGNYSYIQSDSVISNAEIGPYCSIAGGVHIGLAMHPTGMVSTSPVFYDNTQPLPSFFVSTKLVAVNMPRTTIGADVWIGQGALVKAGVRIGVGAVIGAGAVVTKDIAPYTIAVGNPCRPLRARFPAGTCEELLKSRWWELDDADLRKMAPYFQEPCQLCAQIGKAKG